MSRRGWRSAGRRSRSTYGCRTRRWSSSWGHSRCRRNGHRTLRVDGVTHPHSDSPSIEVGPGPDGRTLLPVCRVVRVPRQPETSVTLRNTAGGRLRGNNSNVPSAVPEHVSCLRHATRTGSNLRVERMKLCKESKRLGVDGVDVLPLLSRLESPYNPSNH